jgi:hypothetical protein
MAIKNSQKFSEMEYCISKYFSTNIKPVMVSTQRKLNDNCAEEQRKYNNSIAGMLRTASDESHASPGMDSSSTFLQTTGKWNSKTTEDYLDMVRKQIAGNKTIRKDLVVLAGEWRKTVIAEVGRDAYDRASKQLGGDLSYAYIEYRLEQQMIDHLTAERVPKSSLEYIMRKAADQSLFGMTRALRKTAIDYHIEDQTEALYKPCKIEKGLARATAFGVDTLTTAGISSWSSLARLAGVEVVFAGIENYANRKSKGQKPLSVEQCLSKGLFGTDQNVFSSFRKKASAIQTWEHPAIVSLNHRLGKKMSILEKPPLFKPYFPQKQSDTQFKWNVTGKSKTERSDIPSIIAPGKEDEYRATRKKQEQPHAKEPKQEKPKPSTAEPPKTEVSKSEVQDQPQPVADERKTVQSLSSASTMQESNLSGWQSLISQLGMSDYSKVGNNLGYVIAMLPDVLLGALTGKSSSITLEKDLIPIASVLVGTFIKNPLLKMLFLGLGGGNLLNKAGHEILAETVETAQETAPVYRQYADEALNPRISHPEIRGGTMLCTIDRVSCAIALPATVLDAYEKGALPLNTLANAVLAKHDESRQTFEENIQRQYEEAARQHTNNQGIR